MIAIIPCKKCGSSDVQLWDCGYSSFNPGGGRCVCGHEVKGEAGCSPKKDDLARIWNIGQQFTDGERMDWLVAHAVEVRTPLVYGSRSLFHAQTVSDHDEEYRTSLREQIDSQIRAGLAAAQPAPPDGWWNCQCHGRTEEPCKCGSAVVYVSNAELSDGL